MITHYKHVHAVPLDAWSNTQRSNAGGFCQVITQPLEVVGPPLLFRLELLNSMKEYRRHILAGTHIEAKRIVTPALSTLTGTAHIVKRICPFEDDRVIGSQSAAFAG